MVSLSDTESEGHNEIGPLSHTWVFGANCAVGCRALVAAGTLVLEDAEAKSIAQQLSLLEDASKFKLVGRGAEALADLKTLLK